MANDGDKDTRLASAARRARYLERDEERELTERWHKEKDEQALHQLISSHMRLVIALASRFRNYGLPMSDLVQEGNVGLLEAASRFEPSREVRFSTYAAWWIRAALQDYVLRNWSIVRGGTSSRQKSLFFKLRRLRSRIQARHSDLDPALVSQRIALELGVTAQDVDTMSTRLSGGDISLNVPVGDGASDSVLERQDLLQSEEPQPDELVERHLDGQRRQAWLRLALADLTERELRIVKARRLSEEALTLEELGETLGISKERVRQIENRAVEKLKSAVYRLAEHAPAMH